ncbi:MAG: hypothetical protein IK127_03560 [Clostridia bacterium]|nr:hypothetical protein [Clostridia bacterium]
MRIQKLLALFLALTLLFALAVPAYATTVTVTVNSDEEIEYPPAVIDPALTGQWGYHDDVYGVETVFRFNADGTGLYYANGMEMPIVSYVATRDPYTQYPEDGFLITVYYGEIVMEFEDESFSMSLPPMEYGYQITGNTLRITFTRDIANNYTDFTREPVTD